ncbi:hypothetical protein E3A20_05010 [Planctomyces bekefii]|uniref:Uncharacterized protein n=1 Tax=Planctomyces bekefii TaxID=1653850 RepID=A0A5C6MEK7_9PLAN|nr:hypothetical protein E3A20_05010 [Planctomyces bekefii]
MPLLSKKFVGQLSIAKPEFVMARKGLKNNLASLAKASDQPPSTDSAQKPEEPSKPASPKEQAELMALIKDSVLMKSVSIKNASLKIVNVGATASQEPVRVKDFNLLVTNIGLDRDIKTEISTVAQVAEAGIKVSGPIQVNLINRIKMGGNGLEVATFDGKVDLDALNINAMNAFVKSPSQVLNVAFKGQATTNSLNVDQLAFNLHTLSVTSKVAVSDFRTLGTKAEVTVKNDDLVRLGDLLPQHKSLLVNGSLKLDASVDGPLSEFKKVKADVDLATKLTGSDFSTQVKVESLEPMHIQVAANSSRLDLGAILKPFLPPKDAGAASKPAEKGATSPTPQAQPAEAPATEFELSADQKALLAGSDIRLDVSLKEILFDPINIKDFVIKARVQELRALLENFGLNIFDGSMKVTGLVDLGTSPISYENTFALTDIKPEEAMQMFMPEHKDLLKGKMNIGLQAKGRGTTKSNIEKNLNGKGEFQFKDGELHSASVSALAQEEFDKFVGGLSIASTADDIFKQAEKILDNPMLKSIPNAPTFDLGKYKQNYATLSKVNIADKGAVDKGLKDVKGQIEIKDGRIYITSKKPGAAGNFDFNGSVGLDLTLGGKGTLIASDTTKSKMLSQSKYASLLFDASNNLILNMNLGGTVMDPSVSLDLSAMNRAFTTNAKALVEKEVKTAADQFVNGILKGKKDAVLNELKKKQDELKAKAEAEKQKLEAEKQKVLAEKKKAEDAAKKRAEEEAKKKGGDAGKDKLKGFFKK